MTPRRVGPVPTKHLDRYRHIAGVLADEGLHAVVDVTGLRSLAPRRRSAASQADRLSVEQHIRQAIEKLGVTFIKIGQAASTRTDVIPPRLAEELRKLQDEVTPEPFETVKQVVERELEQPLEAAFASFDPEPIAAASIGQVHRATLPDGTPVAVKVQRPGVREQVDVDLDIALTQARWAADHAEMLRDIDVVDLAEEFADAVRGELVAEAPRRWHESSPSDILISASAEVRTCARTASEERSPGPGAATGVRGTDHVREPAHGRHRPRRRPVGRRRQG